MRFEYNKTKANTKTFGFSANHQTYHTRSMNSGLHTRCCATHELGL